MKDKRKIKKFILIGVYLIQLIGVAYLMFLSILDDVDKFVIIAVQCYICFMCGLELGKYRNQDSKK